LEKWNPKKPDQKPNEKSATMISPKQYYTLVVVSVVSASLSSIFSYVTIVAAWRGKNSSLYQRLLLLLSAANMVGSFALIFHPFSLPQRTREEGLLWAFGNDATCSVSGFFFVSCFPLVSFFHMYLSGYFWAKVRYNAQHTVLTSRRYAWHGVALAIFLCLSLAFMGSASQSFAPRVYHNICSFGDCELGKMDDCRETRGSGVSWYLGWVHLAFVVLPSLVALVMTIAVLATVRAKLIRGQRYDASARNQRLLTTHQQDKLRAVRTQALLYSLSYWNSFFWYFANGSVGRDDLLMEEKQGKPFYFTVAFLSWLLFPLHGLVNYAVYIRPRYLHRRKAGRSRCTALLEAISFEPVSILQHLKPATETRPSQKVTTKCFRFSAVCRKKSMTQPIPPYKKISAIVTVANEKREGRDRMEMTTGIQEIGMIGNQQYPRRSSQ
jgi:hypothetical protein